MVLCKQASRELLVFTSLKAQNSERYRAILYMHLKPKIRPFKIFQSEARSTFYQNKNVFIYFFNILN